MKRKDNIIKRLFKSFSSDNNKKEVKADRSSISATTVYEYYNPGYYSQTMEKLYNSLNFPPYLTFRDYQSRFERQDIANRIVKAPIDGTWKDEPRVFETDKNETKFEKEFKDIAKRLKLFRNLYKLDLLASLGQYSVLYLGLDDGLDSREPVTRASRILYVTPIPEDRAGIEAYENDINSPRYGLPLRYTISVNTEVINSVAKTVHWSRLIHVAENQLDNEVFGVPYLKPIFNRLIGLDKLSGASPEMYWKGARPGYIAKSTNDSYLSPLSSQTTDSIKQHISDFTNDLQRWFFVEGLDVQALSPQVVSPSDHVKVQLELISSATRIPMRILIGSERGELASSQDERAWLGYLDTRREEVGSDLILRPLINRLISLGAISAPSTGDFTIEWNPLLALSEKEQAEIALTKMKALKTYGEAIGGQNIYSAKHFLKDLGLTDDAIELQLKESESALIEEDKNMEKEMNNADMNKQNEENEEEEENV